MVLLSVALLGVWLFVNPNNFKGKIESAVKDSTGRTLQLQGDIKLSVFPWIALELGPATLGSPESFGDQPFVTFTRAAVRAKLLPLLQQKLDIARIELDGLDVSLRKNAAGKGNWEDFGNSTAPAASKNAESSDGGASLEKIGGIKITHAKVSYAPYAVQNFSLETGTIVKGEAVPVTLHVDALRSTDAMAVTVDAKLDMTQQSGNRIALAAFNLDVSITAAASNRPVQIHLKFPNLALDLGAQTLDVPAFDMVAAGAHLNGAIKGTAIKDNLALTGSVTLAPVIIREFLPRLGMTAPKTTDPHALMQVAASSSFVYGDNAARLDGLKVTVDDTHITGNVDVVDLTTLATDFKLNVDKIDLDRYLPPDDPAAQPARETSMKANTEKSAPIEANGTLTVGSIHLSQLDLTNLQATVVTKDKVVHIHPLEALIDGGRYSGDVTLDQRPAVPALSFDEHLTGIDVGKLLASTSGQQKKVHLSGHGNVNFKASGKGLAADTLMKTLDGRMDFNVGDGAVEGIDLGFELARAEALIKRQDAGSIVNAKRTKFDALKMSADIVNGVVTTKDLTISSPVLKVTGEGSLNLPTKGINFALVADAKSATSGSLQIPVKVTGTTADPTVRPDVEAFAKGALKQKLQDTLQDKLKGFFNH